jgi:23S rRNA pseudouridine2605 synthase
MTDEPKPKSPKRKANASPKPRAKKSAKTLSESAPEILPEPTAALEPQTELEGEELPGAPNLAGSLPGEAETEEEIEVEGQPAENLESEAEPIAPSLPGGLLTEGGLEGEDELEGEPKASPAPRPPAKLERLQKILARAGVASRRGAEKLIEEGRIQVNGKVVTELGSKADAARDHIRVDGKLLHGDERLRYFVLNKPKGFVTTVKDPEGRPTVMQFFEKMSERLYPVGRLDYQSEGLLLVTNDGDLANRLTRAASGVEKTYLVKVAGQPTEAELDLLRSGVSIERGKPGSPQVRTSPARVRQVRQGDNPWFEVVLIEGRNRELRKMFQEIGHFVEKIRRVGYGPLVLDQEPGHLRELEPKELELLRKAAEGTLRTPKSKEVRRRNAADAQLPTLPPRPSRPRPPQPVERGATEFRPRKPFAQTGERDRTRPFRPSGKDFAPAPPTGRPPARLAWKKDDRPSRPPGRFAAGQTGAPLSAAGKSYGERPSTGRPSSGGRAFGPKPPSGRPFPDKPAADRRYGARPSATKPAWSKPGSSDRPPYKRPAASRREIEAPVEDLGPRRPSRLHIEPFEDSVRPSSRPPGPGRSAPRPSRNDAGLARPFTTSSGKPRAGGARPSSKPAFRPSGARPSSARSSSRPFENKSAGPSRPFSPAKRSFRREEGEGSSPVRPPRPAGSRPSKPSGWKPKPNFGGTARPASGSRSKPKAGGFSKSSYKGKPSGKRPGGKKRG